MLLLWLSAAASAAIARAQDNAGLKSPTMERGPVDAVVADVALRRSRRLCELGQYLAAETALREFAGSQLTAADSQPVADPHLAGALQLCARIDFESGRFEQALSAARRYDQYLQQLHDSKPEVVSRRQSTLVLEAESLLALGRQRESEQLFQQALDLPGGLHNTDALWEARVAMVRARASDTHQDKSTSDQFWRQVEATARPVVAHTPSNGTERRQRAEALHMVKESLLRTGRSGEAIDLLDHVREQLGPRDPATVSILKDIAQCYERKNDLAKAQQALTAAVELVGRSEQGQTSASYAELLDLLGAMQARQGQSAAARDSWRKAAAIDEKLCAAPANDERRQALRAQHYQDLERLYQHLEDWKNARE